MPNRHICFIAPYIFNYFNQKNAKAAGGAERQQYILGNLLSRDNFQVSYITLSDGVNASTNSDNIEIYPILKRPQNARSIIYSFLSLFRYIRSIDADIYYCRGNENLCIATAISCWILDHDYVYAVADDNNVKINSPSITSSVFTKSLNSASGIISQTEKQNKLLSDNFGLSSTVIPNMYPKVDNTSIISHDDRDFFLWVGSIEENQKRPHIFLQLARDLPEYEFILVGPSNHTDYSTRVIQQARDTKNVTYEGFVKPDNINEYYNRALAVVNTSKFEGFPNTFLEAWNHATPVLSLEFSLDKKLIGNDVGYVANNYRELVDHLNEIASDADLRKNIGSNAREFFENKYCIDVVYPEYRDYLAL